MKKVFLTILSTIALFGLVCSCDEKPNPDKPGGDDIEEPTELVTIDGNFDDWAALKNASSAELGEEFAYPGLLAMKAIADDTNIYVYFEYELQQEGDEDDSPLQPSSPFEIFVDADNNATSGGGSWLWSPIGYEFMLEDETGWLVDNKVVDMSGTMNIYKFDGVDGADAWGEGGHITQLELNSFCESAGKISSGIAKVELSFLRSVVNCTKSGKAAVGLVAYNSAWATTGVLPQGATAGAEALLEVTLP